MPNKRMKASLATKTKTTKINTTWLNNALKSIGVSTSGALKHITPNLYEATSSGVQTTRGIITSLRRNANNTNQISRTLKTNKYVKYAETAYKNVMSDIKTGNFNNIERQDGSMMSSLNGDYGDSNEGFSFGDDGADGGEVRVNYINNGNDAAMLHMSNQIENQTKSQVTMQKATMDAYIAVSSANMQQMGQLGSEVIGQLTNINNNLSALVQYQNENMTKFIEASLAYYDRAGSSLSGGSTTRDSNNSKISAKDVFASGSGGINMSRYKTYVKQQAKKTLENSNVGLLKSIADDPMMMDMIVSNPIGFLSEGLIGHMVPTVLKTSLEAMETTFTNFMPTMLSKIADLADTEGNDFAAKFKRVIGQTFGLRNERTTSMGQVQIDRKAISFDGETKHAITEIITKELRDQTGYLKIIANHYAHGKAEEMVSKGATFWSYNRNKYITREEIDLDIADKIVDSIRDAFNDTNFGKSLRSGLIENRKSDAAKQEMAFTIDEIFIELEKQKGHVTLTDILEIVNSTGASKSTKEVIKKYIKKMSYKDRRSFDSINTGRLISQANANEAKESILEDYVGYNLRNSSFNETDDIDDILAKIKKYGTYSNKKDRKVRGIRGSVGSESSDSTNNNQENQGRFTNLLTRASSGSVNFMQNLMRGNTNEIIQNGLTTIGNGFKHIGEKLKENSEKEGGILWEVKNNFKSMASGIKDGIMLKFFGKVKGEDGKYIEDPENRGGIFGKVTHTFKAGFDGWMDAFFGEDSDDPEKARKEHKKTIMEAVKKNLPNGITGSLVGAGIGMLSGGSVLSMMIGGPLGGAILGATTGFLAKNEKFQKWLFGKENEDGTYTKGLISKKVQDFAKENKSLLIGSAAIGAIRGSIKGGGALGLLVGGPVAGAIMGMAGTIIVKSSMFQEFLFGNEEKGQKGVFKSIADAFNNSFRRGAASQDKSSKDIAKSLGMNILGTGGGALTGALISKLGLLGASLSPFGPVGGAIAGLAISIKAQSSNFKEWLFGKEDGLNLGNGQKVKKQGVLGKFGNILNAHIVQPMKHQIEYIAADFMNTVKGKVLSPFELVAEYTAGKMGSLFSHLSEGVNKTFSELTSFAKDTVTSLFSPLVGAVGGIMKTATSATWAMVRRSISLPGTIAVAVVKALNLKEKFNDLKPVKFFKGLAKDIRDLVLTGIKQTFKLIGNVVAAPFKLLGWSINKIWGGAKTITEKISNSRPVQAIKEKIGDSAVMQKVRKIREGMGTVGDNFMQRFNRRNKDYKKEQARIKEQKKINDIYDANGKIIAKATKGQFSQDTDEARTWLKFNDPKTYEKIIKNSELSITQRAEIESKGKGTRGADLNRVKLDELSEEGKQTKLLFDIKEMILNLIQKKQGKNVRDYETDEEREEREEKEAKELEKIKKEEKIRKERSAFLSVNGKRKVEDLQNELKEKGVEFNPNMGANELARLLYNHEQQSAGAGENSIAPTRGSQINTNIRSIGARLKDYRQNHFFKNSRNFINKYVSNKNETWTDEYITKHTNGKFTSDTDEARAWLQDYDPHSYDKFISKHEKMKIKGPSKGENIVKWSNDFILKHTEGKFKGDSHEARRWLEEHKPDVYKQFLTSVKDLGPQGRIVDKEDSKEKSWSKKFLYKASKGQFNPETDDDITNAVKWLQQNDPEKYQQYISKVTGKPIKGHFLGGLIGKGLSIVGEAGAELLHTSDDGETTALDAESTEEVLEDASKKKNKKNKLTEWVSKLKKKKSKDKSKDLEDMSDEERSESKLRAAFTAGKANGKTSEGLSPAAEASLITLAEQADMRRDSQAEALDKAKTHLELKKEKEEEEAREAQKKYQDDMLSTTKENTAINKEHNGLWNKLWNPKSGLLILGGMALVAYLKNKFPELIDGVWSIVKGIATFLSSFIGGSVKDFIWTEENNARTNGNSISEEASLMVDEFKDGNIITDGNGDATRLTDSALTFLGRRGMNFVFSGKNLPLASKMTKREKMLYQGVKKVGGVAVRGGKKLGNVAVRGGKSLMTKAGNTKALANAVLEYGDEAWELADTRAQKFGAKVINKGRSMASKVGNTKLVTGAKNLGTKAATGAKNLGTKAVTGVKSAGTAVVTKGKNAAAKAAQTKMGQATAKAGKAAGGFFNKICGYIDDFFKWLKNAFFKKFGTKLASNALGEAGEKGIKGALKKSWSKISGKLTSKLSAQSGKGILGTATLGLSELAFATIGAVNGLSGTAKLFYVKEDQVDGTMKLISSIFGALASTTIGGIIDIILAIVGEVVGVDFLSNIAVALYTVVVGKDSEKAKKLEQNRASFKEAYLEYQDSELKKQYETQKKAGLIGEDVTYDMFVQGVEDGTYKASYKSFQDWNANENKSLGGKIASGLSKGWKATKSGFKSLFGIDDKGYEDSKGNKYIDNGDGTYKVMDADGNDLGNISKDALPEDAKEVTIKRDSLFTRAGKGLAKLGKKAWGGIKKVGSAIWGGAKKVGSTVLKAGKKVLGGVAKIGSAIFKTGQKAVKSVKNFFVSHTEKAWFAEDGSYYKSNGTTFDHYTANGDKINDESIDAETIEAMCKSGELTEGEVQVDSTIKKTLKAGIEKLKQGWKNAVEGIKKVAGAVVDKVKSFFGSVKDKVTGVFVGKKTKVWYDTQGCYYKKKDDGTYTYYNMNGDVLKSDIEGSDVEAMIQAGTLTEGEIMEDSAAKKAINKIKDKVKEVWDKAKKTVSEGWDRLKGWLNDINPFGGSGNGGNGYGGSGYIFNSGGFGKEPRMNKISNSMVMGGRGTGTTPDIYNDNPYYSQNDPRWSKAKYSTGDDNATMADTGCGPTAMAMVASSMGKPSTPLDMANLAKLTGNRDQTGTNWNFVGQASTMIGLPTEQTLNPSASELSRQIAMGNPVLLSGVSKKGSSTPYTDAGHYVVAVGRDVAGNVIVNDPRGKSYSRSYNINELANATGSSWIFGGRKTYLSTNKYGGGRGYKDYSYPVLNPNESVKECSIVIPGVTPIEIPVRDLWVYICKIVKKALAKQNPEYYDDQTPPRSKKYTININGLQYTVRPDCSGYVAACLFYFGVLTASQADSLWTGNMEKLMESTKFQKRKYTNVKDLKEGDILLRPGHTQIWAYKNQNNSWYVYNGGSTDALRSPRETSTNKNGFTYVFSPLIPGDNGTDKMLKIFITHGENNMDDLIINETDDATVDENGNAIVDENGNVISSGESRFSKLTSFLGNFFTEFKNRAMGGEFENLDYSNIDEGTHYLINNKIVKEPSIYRSDIPIARKGETVILPAHHGTVNTIDNWETVTNSLAKEVQARGSYDASGYGKINSLYAVETTQRYGRIGDVIDVQRSDGYNMPAIITDIKPIDDSNRSSTQYGDISGQNVIEFKVNNDFMESFTKTGKARIKETLPGKNNSAITSITNKGSILTEMPSYTNYLLSTIPGSAAFSQEYANQLAVDNYYEPTPGLNIHDNAPTDLLDLSKVATQQNDSNIVSGGRGSGSTTIKHYNSQPRYSGNTVKVTGGGRGGIVDYSSSKNIQSRKSTTQYTVAGSTQNYITSYSNYDTYTLMKKAVEILSAIAGNTSDASTKLNALGKLQNLNISGGNSTNVIIGSDGKPKVTTVKESSNDKRNEYIAKQIARGGY